MFSVALEMVLSVALREALSRRHAHLTLEHLLYALAHDPGGEEILQAVGVSLPRLRAELRRYLEESLEQLPKGSDTQPTQTLAFRRVLQTVVLHSQSAGREEANVGDVLAAVLQQPRSQAAQLLAAQGVTRLDVLNFISHGVAKTPRANPGEPVPAGEAADEEGPARPRDALAAYHGQPDRERAPGQAGPAGRPRGRAGAGAGGPVPPAQEQPGVRGRGRRRQDRPGGRPGPAAAGGRRAGAPEGRRGLQPGLRRAAGGHALPGGLRGALQGADGRPFAAAEAHPVHRRAAHHGGSGRHHRRHHGPGQPGQAHPVRRQHPSDGLDHVRRVQAHREGPRPAPAAAEDRRGRALLRGHRPHPAGAAEPVREAPRRALHPGRPRHGGAPGPAPPAASTACRTAPWT